MDFLGASVVSCQLSVVSCQLWGALGIARMLDRKPLRLTQANSENSSKKKQKVPASFVHFGDELAVVAALPGSSGRDL